jgi:hypothetical protein
MLGIDDLSGPEAAEPSLAVHPAADCWCVRHAVVHPPCDALLRAACCMRRLSVVPGSRCFEAPNRRRVRRGNAASRMLHAGCRAAWRGLHVACVMLQPVVLQCSCALYRAWLVLHVAFSAPMCRIRPCCIRPCCIRPCCIGYATLCARCAGRAVWRSVFAIVRL